MNDGKILNIVTLNTFSELSSDIPNNSLCVCKEDNTIYFKEDNEYFLILDNNFTEEDNTWKTKL